MTTNSELTIYHKIKNNWHRFNYKNVWCFKKKIANSNKGYENSNSINIRIFYDLNNGLDINNFDIGDIIVPSDIELDINSTSDLKEYNVYHITSIVNNIYGLNTHIHIKGE